ncbi:MAG: hypothetical protein AB8B68_05240 [Rickettsiaceae bacterium]
MLSKTIILILATFLLSSCVTGPEGYFKKSANNKLFDKKGFKNGKRAPLYNKKYIAKAKQNVANDDYEEEEDYDSLLENENISQANRDMYRRILENEVESKYLGKGRKVQKTKAYPVLIKNSARPDAEYNEDNLQLRAELDQIKAMLDETKNEMANYRCPTAQEIERAGVNSSTKNSNVEKISDEDQDLKKEKLELIQKLQEQDALKPTIIHPVKSI